MPVARRPLPRKGDETTVTERPSLEQYLGEPIEGSNLKISNSPYAVIAGISIFAATAIKLVIDASAESLPRIFVVLLGVLLAVPVWCVFSFLIARSMELRRLFAANAKRCEEIEKNLQKLRRDDESQVETATPAEMRTELERLRSKLEGLGSPSEAERRGGATVTAEDIDTAVTISTVVCGVLSFAIQIVFIRRKNGDPVLEDLVIRAGAASCLPTGVVLVACAFKPSLISNFTGLNFHIAAAGMILLFISIKAQIRK